MSMPENRRIIYISRFFSYLERVYVPFHKMYLIREKPEERYTNKNILA